MPPTQEFNDALTDLVTAAKAAGAAEFQAANPPIDPAGAVTEAQADDLAAVNAAKVALQPTSE